MKTTERGQRVAATVAAVAGVIAVTLSLGPSAENDLPRYVAMLVILAGRAIGSWALRRGSRASAWQDIMWDGLQTVSGATIAIVLWPVDLPLWARCLLIVTAAWPLDRHSHEDTDNRTMGRAPAV